MIEPLTVTEHPLRIAVLLPRYNEELSIAQTVAGFRAVLPACTL